MATYDDGMRAFGAGDAIRRLTRWVLPAGPTLAAPAAAPLVLSAQPANARSRALAMGVIAVSILVFLSLVQVAKQPLAAYPNFLPLVQTVLIVNDVITALLLVLQLRVTRSAGLLVLACGYVYTSLMAMIHLLSFPGVFAAQGLLGGGPQTTGYLFVFWHVGYPLSVLGYLYFRRAASRRPFASLRRPVAAALAATVLLVAAIALLVTLGHDLFPPMLEGNRYSSPFNVGRYGQWLLTACAILVLWKKGRTALDLWLLVALWSWFIEIALVGIFNAGRYDVGFYAGRVYGLLSSTFVLAILLVEQATLYSDFLASTEKEREGAAVRADRNVLRLAMAAGGMGAWSLDLASRQVWVSAELEGILGFAPGAFSGQPVALLRRIHRNDIPRMRKELAEAGRHGNDFALELRFCHRKGEWQWLDLRGRVVPSADGSAAKFVGVCMDITQRKHSQEAQARMAAALRENDRRKDEFLATLAHELRNPLAPIRNAVELMARMQPLPPGVERLRGVVDRQSRQLARLVDDLLDVSRITQGKIRLQMRQLCVLEVLRDAVDATRAAADAAGHELTVETEEAALQVEGDPTRLTQVFVNLLNNAIKFTPQGGRIHVQAGRRQGQAWISVRDNGIGISPEHRESIFGIFTQVQLAPGQAHGGLGIGLALVRGFVELHGGTVEVDSGGIGGGTEFRVRLPLAPAAGVALGAGTALQGA
jgi:PAS domain S-box-containing protein